MQAMPEARVRPPQASATAAGNLAGCAVASTTIGTPGSANRSADVDCGRAYADRAGSRSLPACCGSSRPPRPSPSSGRLKSRRGSLRAGRPSMRERARLLAARPCSAAPRRRRGRRSRTAAARNSTTPGCPSTARWSRRLRALRYSPLARVRARMSLSLVAITSRSIGRPIRLAA